MRSTQSARALLLRALIAISPFALLVSCSDVGSSPAADGTVDARGGTVRSADGVVTVTIPPGALSQPARITIVPSPTDGTVAQTAYAFGPDGQTFARPVTIDIRYVESNLTAGASEEQLHMVQVLEPVWEGIAGSRTDTTANVVSGAVTHFSNYGVVSVGCSNAPVLLDPRTPLIDVGSSQQFVLTVALNGTRRVNVGHFATWASSETSVATVGGTGLAVGIGVGVATITATYGRCIPNEYSTRLLVLDRGSMRDAGAGDSGAPADASIDAPPLAADTGAITDRGPCPTCSSDVSAPVCAPVCPTGALCHPSGACLCTTGQAPCARSSSSSGVCCALGMACVGNTCQVPNCSPACPAAARCMSGVCVCSAGQVPCGRSATSAGVCCGPGQTCNSDRCETRTTCRFECTNERTCQNGECTCPALPACGPTCPCPIGEVCGRDGRCGQPDGGMCVLPDGQCNAYNCCVGSCSNRSCSCGTTGGLCNSSPNGCCSGVCLPPDASGTRLCACSPSGGYCAFDNDCCGSSCDRTTRRCR